MSRLDVSDHAVLNWLEKVEGVDVAGIRRRIAKAARNAVEQRASGVRVEGVTFKLEYGAITPVVTTTLSPRARPHLAQPRRRPAAGD
jgi:hypothetical protein